MKCLICDEVKNLRINTDKCRMCTDCFKAEVDKADLQNNVLYYIRENSDRATYKALCMKCESTYEEAEISMAKQHLIDHVLVQLNEVDEVLAKEVATKRMKSKIRSKAAAEIHDIYTILDALGLNIRITAVDMTKISLINPESLLPDSVVQRLTTQESDLAALKDEIVKLTAALNLLTGGAGGGATSPPLPPPGAPPSRHILTNVQKHQVSIAATNHAAATAAQAVQDGLSTQDAQQMGAQAAKTYAKTFAQIAKASGHGNIVSTAPPAVAAAAAGGGAAVSNSQFPLPPWQVVGKSNKKRLSQTTPYKTGTGDTMVSAAGTSVVPVKPAHLENETLVIAGFNRDLTKEQFVELVNTKARKDIDFQFIQPLSKAYSKWKTVAIELKSDDYEILNDPNFWDPQLRIRPYIGHKFWRGNRQSRLKTHEIRTAVRDSWVAQNPA